ncbi:MAG: urease accessory UreF family protein [Chromatiales bacterium]|jgi:urease accessory protein
MPTESALPLLRLLQLVSPSLPTGAFTYSQGIEWSVEAGWIRDAADLEAWLSDQMKSMLARVDLPLLLRMRQAIVDRDKAQLDRWIDALLASRETRELREEESNRGRALADLLGKLELAEADAWRDDLARSQAAGFAFAATRWRIPADQLALGYAWGWLENLVLAAVKIIPLGQSEGQRLLERLAASLAAAVDRARALDDEDIGAANPALAIASSRHETQYTRLFRS